MDWLSVVQAALFALFAVVTAAVNTIIAPTYDNLFVPEMSPSALYAPYLGGGASSLFSRAAVLSNYVLFNVVDPLAVLVIIAVGLLYLVRASLPKLAYSWDHLAPRVVVGILLANLVLPITSLLWDVAAEVYPVFYSYDGSAWASYSNIIPAGGIYFSWDNGILAFAASLVLFSLVLMLTFLIAFRDALVAVLLVLLPPLTLLWPIPQLSGLAKRSWRLFGEMVFLPSLVVVPLALAVGSSSVLIVIALFAAAVGMPILLTQAGANLASAGFPHSGSIVSGGYLGGVDRAGKVAQTNASHAGGGLVSGSGGSAARSAGSTAIESVRKGAQASSSVSGVAGGPLGVSAAALWGAGNGLGRLGTIMTARKGSVATSQTSLPKPLPKDKQINIG